MSGSRLLRQMWRALPEPLRRAVRTFSLVRSAEQAIARRLSHQELYDAHYYEMVDREARRSVPAIARSIVRDLAPRTVLDIGCGTGALLEELRRLGVTCSGYEYSEAGLAVCRARGLDVHQFDLESPAPEPSDMPVDVVISTEVAEHLPERLAERYVDRLCRRGRVIVFTAATPGQGGHDHVNEQPHAYWQQKIAARGWTFDERLSLCWRAEWEQAETAPWYSSNLMVFRRGRR